jgi:hypothetical protein
MSKSSDINKAAKRHILESIDLSGYYPPTIKSGAPQPPVELSPAARVAALRCIFDSEYGWAVNRYGMQGAIKEWLSGLPTACTIAFNNHEILTLAREWGSLPATPDTSRRGQSREDMILNNWFNFMANALNQMFHSNLDSLNKL